MSAAASNGDDHGDYVDDAHSSFDDDLDEDDYFTPRDDGGTNSTHLPSSPLPLLVIDHATLAPGTSNSPVRISLHGTIVRLSFATSMVNPRA